MNVWGEPPWADLGWSTCAFESSYKTEGGKALFPGRLRYSSDSKGGCAMSWLSHLLWDVSPLPDVRQRDVGHCSRPGEGMLLVVECGPEKVTVCFFNEIRSDGSR